MAHNTDTEHWPAPHTTTAVQASVSVPASKSLTNRYLTLAALAGTATLHNPLSSRDSDLMVAALAKMGITTSVDEETGAWVLKHTQPPSASAPVLIDCGLAGTVMRFAPVIAAIHGGDYIFDGDDGARTRPMAELLKALTQQGVTITQLDTNHQPTGGDITGLPFRLVSDGKLPGGPVTLDSSATSQYITALLFLGVATDAPLVIEHTGQSVPSPDHIGMTATLLREHGITVTGTGPRWEVTPGPIKDFTATVEPDLSNAGPFLAAAVVTGGTVCVPNWPLVTTQVGDQWRNLLPRFGATVTVTPDEHGTATVCVTGTSTTDENGKAQFNGAGTIADSSELAPTLAAIAALAQTPTQLTGIAHLRGHETDRLAALTKEINALGGNVTETDDGLIIEPAPLTGGVFGTYHDHRMATAGAILGLVVENMQVENIATTGKTMPEFPELWADMVAEQE